MKGAAACKGRAGAKEVSVQSGASVAADVQCAAPDEGGRLKKNKKKTSCAENIMELNAESPSRGHYPLLIPLIEPSYQSLQSRGKESAALD